MVQLYVLKQPMIFTISIKIKLEKLIKLFNSTEILMELLKLMQLIKNKINKKSLSMFNKIWRVKLKMDFLSEKRKVSFLLTIDIN